MIKRICTFCHCELGFVEGTKATAQQISHGICPSCIEEHFADYGEELADFLNEIPVPVAVISHERRVHYANTTAQEILGKNIQEIQGQLGGDVFRCSYAHLPEGCGKTIHCHSCTINRLVMKTAETGTAFHRIGAYLDMDGLSGIVTVKLLISTEKIGQLIFLRIDRIEPVTNNIPP